MTPEDELRVEEFFNHFEAWLLQQPEWLYIVGLPEREARRRVAKTIASTLTTIPVDSNAPLLGRAVRRSIIRDMKKGNRFE
jgi:hypothetical protein